MKKVELTNERKSNFELMRIISMFFIVMYHLIYHGQILEHTTSKSLELIIKFIELTIIIHVNSYVLITGYFQSQSTFKQSKVWKIINQSLFYRIIIIIIMLLIGTSIDKVTIYKELFPIDRLEYWFIKVYLLLYLISPFINKLIKNLTKKEIQRLLVVLFIIVSIIPMITQNETFTNNGYNIESFIFMYLIGAYLKKYKLQDSYLFKKLSKKLYKIVLIVIFFSMIMLNFTFFYFFKHIDGTNSLLTYFAHDYYNLSLYYNNPFIIIQSVCYYCFFESLDFKSKIVNNLSKLTLGVYMIHDNNFIRPYISKIPGISVSKIYSYSFISYLFSVAITLYLVCSLIEYLRQVIFKFIYNLKLSEKFRNRYYSFLKNIYIRE